jgi:site-specific DNA-cytosine methylase
MPAYASLEEVWGKNYDNINLSIDIENLTIKDIPFIPDIIWASPDCTTYSIASISKHRNGIIPKSDYAKKCDKVNEHFILLINEWKKLNNNLVFFIENPRGMMRKMPFISQFKRNTVWYCQYGDLRAKPTDIFTNSINWIPKKQCKNNNPDCNHQRASRGSNKGTQSFKNSFYRSIIPSELCIEILKNY